MGKINGRMSDISGFGLTLEINGQQINSIPSLIENEVIGEMVRIEPVKITVTWEVTPRPYNIFWSLLTGYPMLTRYMGAN